MIKDSLTGPAGLLKRSEAIRALAAVVLIAAISWYFGVDAWHAILLGCAVTVIVLATIVGTSTPERIDPGWLHRRPERSTGARHEVAELSNSLRAGWGRVGATAERRLIQVANRRLAHEGLNLQDPEQRPAIELRIGASAYRLLTRHHHRRRMRLRAVVRCLDALDALDAGEPFDRVGRSRD